MARSNTDSRTSSPQPGDLAPTFALPDAAGRTWKLASAKGKWVVLYFYPKALSPSCTKQACDLGGVEWGGLAPLVVGVSPDAPATLAKFIAKSKLSVGLLADVPAEDGVPPVCNRFGAWGEKSMYGKLYQGVLRTTFLIDPKGVVRARWDAVRVPGHAAAVCEQLAVLRGGRVKPAAKTRVRASRKAASKGRRAGRASISDGVA